jgi:hypothetical protein
MSAPPFPDLDASKSGPIDLTCQCQKIKITIPSLPEFANVCDCSLCFKYGAAWGYWDPDLVTIKGKPVTLHRPGQEEDKDIIHYVWKTKRIAFGHCAHCGTTLYWKLTEQGHAEEAAKGETHDVAINMKLLGPEIFKTLKHVCLD